LLVQYDSAKLDDCLMYHHLSQVTTGEPTERSSTYDG
jgi:hypothetical protein